VFAKYKWSRLALLFVGLNAVAQENAKYGAFAEMLPDVAYSATRTMVMENGSINETMISEVVYTPRKEWSSTKIGSMKDMAPVISMTDFDGGVSYTKMMGIQQQVSLPPVISLEEADGAASLQLSGVENIDGVPVNVYEFTYNGSNGKESYRSSGTLYQDRDGIPRRMDWTVITDKQGEIRIRQNLSNVQVGPQDESLFAGFEASHGDSSGTMGTLMAAAGGSAGMNTMNTSAPAAAIADGSGQSKTVRGKIDRWGGANGQIIDDNGSVVGSIDTAGNLEIVGGGAPNGGIYPIGGSAYQCSGATVSNAAARYHVRGEGLAVVEAGSMQPIGRVIAASSEAIAGWWANPVNNGAEVGFTIRMVYVDQPVKISGTCDTGGERTDYQLDLQAGWNIEKRSIQAVGKSPYFPSAAPTQSRIETVAALPAGTVWAYEDMSPGQNRGAASDSEGDMPEPVQEVVDEVTDVATDVVKEEAGNEVRKGLKKLFGR